MKKTSHKLMCVRLEKLMLASPEKTIQPSTYQQFIRRVQSHNSKLSPGIFHSFLPSQAQEMSHILGMLKHFLTGVAWAGLENIWLLIRTLRPCSVGHML